MINPLKAFTPPLAKPNPIILIKMSVNNFNCPNKVNFKILQVQYVPQGRFGTTNDSVGLMIG
jgi:hypothetical protein